MPFDTGDAHATLLRVMDLTSNVPWQASARLKWQRASGGRSSNRSMGNTNWHCCVTCRTCRKRRVVVLCNDSEKLKRRSCRSSKSSCIVGMCPAPRNLGTVRRRRGQARHAPHRRRVPQIRFRRADARQAHMGCNFSRASSYYENFGTVLCHQ